MPSRSLTPRTSRTAHCIQAAVLQRICGTHASAVPMLHGCRCSAERSRDLVLHTVASTLEPQSCMHQGWDEAESKLQPVRSYIGGGATRPVQHESHELAATGGETPGVVATAARAGPRAPHTTAMPLSRAGRHERRRVTVAQTGLGRV